MRREPIITPAAAARTSQRQRIAADGQSFAIHEWRGSGPPHLHVHHEDDEAWHVLEGTLRFRFADRTVDAGPGTTVFVPAGVAHTYEAFDEARYLVILTPRLRALIAELQAARDHAGDDEIFRRHSSEVLE
jgi:mannose-6-phosphate isomerase-like protein (cupin superfamily)